MIQTKAKQLLMRHLGNRPERINHAFAMAGLCEDMCGRMNPAKIDRQAVISACLVHDIGMAPELKKSGIGSIDSAIYLRGHGMAGVAGIVQRLSTTYWEAIRMNVPLERYCLVLPDLKPVALEAKMLTYACMHVDSSGQVVSLEKRMGDISERYGKNHAVYLSCLDAMDHLKRIFWEIEQEIGFGNFTGVRKIT